MQNKDSVENVQVQVHLFTLNQLQYNNNKKKKKEVKTELTIHWIKHNKRKKCVAAKGAKLSSWLLSHSGYKFNSPPVILAILKRSHKENCWAIIAVLVLQHYMYIDDESYYIDEKDNNGKGCWKKSDFVLTQMKWTIF